MCSICKIYAHKRRDCPNLHVKLNKYLVINKHLYYCPVIERLALKKKRTLNKKFSAISNNYLTRSSLKDFRIDILFFMYKYEL